MQKVYERIVWVDFPSTKTALASRLLNKMDYAIDEIDNRVVELSGYQEEALLSEQNSKESEIKAKISETNAKESEVKSKEYMEKAFAGTPEGYDDLVDRVNSPVIRQTTEETIVGCEDGGLKLLKVGGNSYQRTRGNKLNLNGVFDGLPDDVTEVFLTDMGVKVTYVADEERRVSHIVVKGTNGGDTTLANNFVTEDALILNGCIGGSKDTYYLFFRDTDGVYYYDYGNGVSIPKGKTGAVGVYASAGTETTMYPMLSKEGGAYEPYGLPYAPSPERKSDIANFGDCVDIMQGKWYTQTGLFVTDDTCVCSTYHIPCKKGDIISISTENPLKHTVVFYNGETLLSTITNANVTNNYTATVPSGCDKFAFYVKASGAINPSTVGKITLTVNGKYPLVIRKKSKNLAKLQRANSSSYELIENEDGTYTTIAKASNEESGIRTPLTKRLKKGVYTLTNIQCSGKAHIRIGVDSNWDKFANVGESFTFEYDGVSPLNLVLPNVKSGESVIYKIQLEEGSVATDFVPARETQTIVWLEKPLMQGDELCKKDGKWYIKRNRSSVVLGSSVGFSYLNGMFYTPTSATPNMKHKANILCDSYMTTTQTDMPDLTVCAFKGDGYRIWFKDTRFGEDAYAFKAYLDTIGGVYVEYELAEPVFEELSSDMQLKLNELETYADVTHIIIDSHIKTSGILSEYGTTKIASYTLKSLLNSESNKVLIEELSTAIMAVGSEE